MDEYVRDFVQESTENVTELNNALLDLEREPENEEAMDRIFRMAHTLKGNAGAMGFDAASDLAHAIEDLLDAVRSGKMSVTADLMDDVFDAVDQFELMLDDVREHGEIRTDPSETIENLRAVEADATGARSIVDPDDDEIESALANANDQSDADHTVYHVRLSVVQDPDVNNSAGVVKALEDAFDLLGTRPERSTVEAGETDGRFDAVFGSAVTPSAIEAALEPVDAVDDWIISDVTGMFESLDADADAGDAAGSGDGLPDDPGADIDEDIAKDMSVDELLGEFDEYDDLDALVEEMDDVSGFDDLGEAGSFDDLDLGEDLDPADQPATDPLADDDLAGDDDLDLAGDDDLDLDDDELDLDEDLDLEDDLDVGADAGDAASAGGSADDEEVEDAAETFAELKQEVDPVGFDELQDELDELEFDEYSDEEEVGFDELLGDDFEEGDDDFFGGEGDVDEDALDDMLVDEDTDVPGFDEADAADEAAEPIDADAEGADADAVEADADAVEADADAVEADADAVEADADAVEADADAVEADEPVPEDGVAVDDAVSDEDELVEGTAEAADAAAADADAVEADADAVEADADAVEADADAVEADADAVEADADAAESVPAGGDDEFGFEDDTASAADAGDFESVDDAGEFDEPVADASADVDDDFGADFELDEADPDDETVVSDPADAVASEESETAAPDEPVSTADLDSTLDDEFDVDELDTAEGDTELDLSDGETAGDTAGPLAGSSEEDLESVEVGQFELDEADTAEAAGDAAVDTGDFDGDTDASSAAGVDSGLTDSTTRSGVEYEGIDAGGFDDVPDDAQGEAVDVPEGEMDPEEARSLVESTLPRRADADDSDSEVQSVRVDIDQVDRLLNLVEGLVTNRVRLRRSVDEDADPSELDDELDELEDITGELQDTVMDIRLVPLKMVANQLPRVVRDVSREQGKTVDFEMEGDDVEMDRTILDEISDPLVHLVRNAVDHGIESPEERSDLDKPDAGQVTLRARRERDRVVVEVEDDGRGLDPDVLRDEAVEEGIMDREEAEELSDDDARELVFHPGLSTAPEVTDVSGRGVGMDVVQSTVDELDGEVEIDSELGAGTTIRLVLPVSVAIDDVLFVDIGDEEYGVPTKVVRDIGSAAQVEQDGDREVVRSDEDGEDTPLIRLGDALETPGASRSRGDGMLLHVRGDVRNVALHCDEVRNQQEVVVKPYDDVLGDIPGLSGATVLGEGEVVNILDVKTL